jgi:hypothetical protein
VIYDFDHTPHKYLADTDRGLITTLSRDLALKPADVRRAAYLKRSGRIEQLEREGLAPIAALFAEARQL